MQADAPTKPTTPQLEKMLAVHDESHGLGEFLAVLNERGYVLCEWRTDLYIEREEWPDHPDRNEPRGHFAREDSPDPLWGGHSPPRKACPHPVHEQWVRVSKSIEQILAEHFEIDLTEISREREAVLEYIRALSQNVRDMDPDGIV